MSPRCRRSLIAILSLVVLPLAVAAPARADRIDDYIKAEMQKRRIPGLALAVVRNGTVVKMKGYGLANLDHDVPVTPDTVFELASVTKQFTAAAIMTLVEEGKLQLDDPILWHLPQGPATWSAITVRHLLTHTAGLPGLEENFKALWPGGPRLNYSTVQLFNAATKDPHSFPAGERFQYSDVGYFLLGMIIEHVSGQRYAGFRGERFFRPPGMTSTPVLDPWKMLKHRAAGYTIPDGQLVHTRPIAQAEAGRYTPGILVRTQKARPDPDPAATEQLRDSLGRLSRGESDPTVNPRLPGYVSKNVLAERLRTLQSFTFVTCDDVRGRNME